MKKTKILLTLFATLFFISCAPKDKPVPIELWYGGPEYDLMITPLLNISTQSYGKHDKKAERPRKIRRKAL